MRGQVVWSDTGVRPEGLLVFTHCCISLCPAPQALIQDWGLERLLSLQDGWREECTRHLNMGGSPYSQSPLWIKMSQGKQVACHKYLLVAFSNSNAELSNFISMIIYLHCTDTKEKHPQVHSTIQYIYFKNIILYKRFIEHWHVRVTNSQSLSPICDSQNASKYCQFTITGHH